MPSFHESPVPVAFQCLAACAPGRNLGRRGCKLRFWNTNKAHIASEKPGIIFAYPSNGDWVICCFLRNSLAKHGTGKQRCCSEFHTEPRKFGGKAPVSRPRICTLGRGTKTAESASGPENLRKPHGQTYYNNEKRKLRFKEVGRFESQAGAIMLNLAADVLRLSGAGS